MMERLGRSWLGALLDIGLIVGSILIAFSLDAWWDGRARSHQEREALNALAEELHSSRVELDSVIAFNEMRLEAERYFLALPTRRIDRLPVDSLRYVLAATGGGMTFDPSLGATEAIVSEGLDLISSAYLRARVAAWPGMLREIEVDQAAIVDRWEKVSDALVDARLASRMFGLHENGWQDTAAVRSVSRLVVADPPIRERVAALGRSIDGLLAELTEVDGRLAELEASVAAQLD